MNVTTLVYFDGEYARAFTAAGWVDPVYQPPFALLIHNAVAGNPAWVMVHGILRDVDTSAWLLGDSLWADGVAGGITNATPTYVGSGVVAPVISVGIVRVSSATVGVIEVSIRVYPPHSVLSGRSVSDSHPATAISHDPTDGLLTSTDVQAAVSELADDALFHAAFLCGGA